MTADRVMAADKCKPAHCFGPFKERLLSAQSRLTCTAIERTPQSPRSPGVHANLCLLQLLNAAGSLQMPSHCQMSTDSSNTVTDQQQQPRVSNINSPSHSRPASKQAATCIAAAEAAVAAADAVLNTASGTPQQRPPPQTVHTSGALRQQQQRLQKSVRTNVTCLRIGLGETLDVHSAIKPVVAQDVSCNRPQPGEHNTSASSQGSSTPLQVQGRKAANQQQHHLSDSPSRSLPAANAKAYEMHNRGTVGGLSEVSIGTAAQSSGLVPSLEVDHPCQQMGCRQLLQCSYAAASSSQQSPAMAAAVQAVHKRLKIQQRSRQGPPAFHRGPLPRLRMPEPVELTGTLILGSCPDAATPVEVLSADLSSAAISSICMPAATVAGMAAADTVITSADKQESSAGAGMPAAVSLSDFKNLGVLDLSDNMLSCIAGLSWLPALWQLAVPANRLRTLQSLSQVLEHQTPQYSKQVALLAASAETSPQGTYLPEEVVTAVVAAVTLQPTAAVCSGGFGQLQVLDVSYNMLSADDLLGKQSPLAHLPRLSELLAAGNSLSMLPAELGAFTGLTHLDLAHNKLTGAALKPLGQLPALLQLLLSHNPIKNTPNSTTGTAPGLDTLSATAEPHTDSGSSDTRAAGAAGACSSYKELTWLDLSHSRVSDAQRLVELLRLPKLCVLQLTGCPLADQCWSGRDKVQVLQHHGLTIITHEEEPLALWQHNPKQRTKHHKYSHAPGDSSSSSSSTERWLPITVENDAPPIHVLAAAGKTAILMLQHEQLVAAFQHVDKDIDNWQLAPVAEEDSTALLLAQGGYESQRQDINQKVMSADEEPTVDQTFLTGVGITAELPDGNNEIPDASIVVLQDPTERLALALGLQVEQLAHHTHKNLGNPVGPVHKLRHALTHPIIEPEAGQRPQQHHASLTAAAAAKQRPRQLLPLPQPIPTALSTGVVAVEGIDGALQSMRSRLQALESSLLQQVQAQADKLSAAMRQSTESAAGGVTVVSVAQEQLQAEDEA